MAQTTLNFPNVANPNQFTLVDVYLDPPLIDEHSAFDPANIKAGWKEIGPQPSIDDITVESRKKTPFATTKTKIPSTRHWTDKQVRFFKLRYFQVPRNSWTTFICPSRLTAQAEELALSAWSGIIL